MTGQADTIAHCLRCGRKLTAKRSIGNGYGYTCRRRVREAVATIELPDIKADQRDRAVELIEAGGIVPSSRPGVFFAVSSDGSTTYVADLGEETCTCKAGQNGRACYHLAAARLVAAASVRRAA